MMTIDMTQDPAQMLTFDLDDSTIPHGSLKKKMVFPEDRVGAMCFLHVLYPEPQVVAGWAKPGHVGDYFYTYQSVITVMRKASLRRKSRKNI